MQREGGNKNIKYLPFPRVGIEPISVVLYRTFVRMCHESNGFKRND